MRSNAAKCSAGRCRRYGYSVGVLHRISDRDPNVLDDSDERWAFERAVSRLEARRPFLSDGFEPDRAGLSADGLGLSLAEGEEISGGIQQR